MADATAAVSIQQHIVINSNLGVLAERMPLKKLVVITEALRQMRWGATEYLSFARSNWYPPCVAGLNRDRKPLAPEYGTGLA